MTNKVSFNTEDIFTSSELGSDASEGCVGVVDTGLKVWASTLRIKGASGTEGVDREDVFDGMKDVGWEDDTEEVVTGTYAEDEGMERGTTGTWVRDGADNGCLADAS